MAWLDDYRKVNPWATQMGDADIINLEAQQAGADPRAFAESIGVPVNQPGFWSTVRRSGAQLAGGIGEVYGDVTGHRDNGLSNWAEDVAFRNPSGINSLQDVADNPWLAVKEGTANAATFLVPGAGLKVAANVARGAKALNAARMIDNPLTQAAVAGAPSLTEIGDSQREAGRENLALKYLGAGAVGAIENLGGVQRMLGLGRAPRVLSKADEVAEFGASPWRTVGKTMGRSALEEGAEELPQTFIEKAAGYQDPFTAKNLEEAALGGVMGAIGGGVLGAGHGAARGLRQAAINRQMSTDLLNPDNTSFGQLRDSAEWKQAFMNTAGGDGNTWFNDLMREQFDRRNQMLWNQQAAAQHVADQGLAGPMMQGQLFPDEGDGYAAPPMQVMPSGNDDVLARREQLRVDRQQIGGYVESMMQAGNYDAARTALPVIDRIDQQLAGINSLLTDENGFIEGRMQPNPQQLGLALGNPGGLNAAQYTPVAPTGAQGARPVVGGSAGNLATQPVGRGGSPVTPAPVASSAANPLVGNPRGGNGGHAVTKARPGTVAALQAQIDAAFPVGSEDHQEHSNALATAKNFTAARKSLAKTSPTGLKIALRTAPQEEQLVVQTALGWDNEGNQVATAVPSYAGIASKIGKTKQRVQQILAQYGINKAVLEKVHVAAQQTVDVSELMPSQQEEGGVQAGTGFRIMDNPNAADDFIDDARTRRETQAANQFAAERGVKPSELSTVNGENDHVLTADEAAINDRVAAQARLNADLIFDELLSHPEAQNAATDWDEMKKSESPSFSELTRGEQAELVNDYAEAIDDGFEAIVRAVERFENSLESNRGSTQTSVVGQETRVGGATAETQQSVPEELGEVPRLAESQPLATEPTERADSEAGRSQQRSEDEVTEPSTVNGKNGAKTESGVQFSKGAGGATQAGTIAAKLKPLFFSGTRFDNRVVVVQSATELPEGLRSYGDDNTQAFVKGGKVYMIADNIAEGKELAVFLHEVGVHLGMAKLIGPENFNKLVEQVKVWAESDADSTEAKLARAALRRVLKAEAHLGEDYSQPDFDEELVAYFVEEAVNAGINPTALGKSGGPLQQWFNTLWVAIKTALRKFGVDRLDRLSAQDVVDLAYGAASVELQAETTETAATTEVPDEIASYYARGKDTSAEIYSHQAGLETYAWGDDKSLAGLTGIASFARANPDGTGGLLIQYISGETAGFATNPKPGVDPLFDAAVLSVNLQKAGGRNTYELTVTGPIKGTSAWNKLSAEGKASQGNGAGEIGSKFTRLEGVTATELGRVLAEARRRLTRLNNGVVPNIIHDRMTGANIGKAGAYPAETLKVKFSKVFSDERIAETTSKLPPAMRDWAYKTATNLVDLSKRGVYATVFGHDLARMVETHLPSAKTFFNLKSKQSAELTRRESEIDAILERAHDAKDIDALNAFLNESTRTQKWGYDVKNAKGEVIRTADPVLAVKFKALSKASQAAAREIFTYGYKTIKAMNDLVKRELANDYSTEGLPPEEAKKLEKKKLRTLALFDKTFKALQGPYAPLVRVGNYIMSAKSQAYIDAVVNGDDTLVETLQQNPAHYLVTFHESLGEAKLAARQAAATGNYAKGDNAPEGFAKEHFYNKSNETPWGALKRIAAVLDSEQDEAESKEARKVVRGMKNLLNDLYYSMLAEGSARQFQNRRRNIHGEMDDMLRAFAVKGRADANFLSQLEYSKPIIDSIQSMRAEAMKNEGGDRADRVRALNEILSRQAASMEYRYQPALAKLQGLTSFWMLVTNPAYYLQNATQPFMMSLPYLAGKYGYSKSWGAFNQAYRDLTRGKLDIDQMPISPAEKDMLRGLKNDGILDIGINRDLGYWANSDNRGVNVAAKVQHFFNRKIQQLEMVNRVSTALAAYRLSGDVGAAKDAIRTTHGDYAQFNEPGFFSRVPAAKLLLQFRKFQIIQLSMLARLIKNSFPSEFNTKEERAAAQKSLAFLLGHVAVMTGALGMPLMNLLGPVVAAAVGGDGDPDDPEYLLRKLIDDKDLADLLLRGVPAAVGVDMSNRLGMQNMTALTPFAQKDPLTKEGFNERVVALAGPWAGLGARVVGGVGQVLQGDITKGLESMLPSGLGNTLKAYRFATEGVTLKNNDVVVSPDEINAFTAAFQALGLPTTQLSDRQRLQGNLIEFEAGFKARTGELKKDYAYAVRRGEDTGDIREAWSKLQQAMQRNGFKAPPLSDLLKAPQEQAKRERQVANGVEYRKNNRAFVQGVL